MIKHIVLLTTLIALSFSSAALAAEPGSGTIQGQIVNSTEGGGSVADQEITLKTFLNDTETTSSTSKTSPDGQFTFDGLSTGSSYSYQITITYQEAEYNGERLSFGEGETTKSTMLTVYDSTQSDEAIKVTDAHTIIYPGEGSLEIMEFYRFTNETDHTYIGSGEITATGTRRTLRFPLPEKMTGLQYGGELMECCVLNSEDGLTDTMAVMPGTKEIAYSYRVDYKSGGYDFSQKINYPIANYNFLVKGETSQVASDRLVSNEPVDIEGASFNYLSGGQLLPGDIVTAQLSGLPESSNQGTILWTVLALVALSGGFGLSYLMKKNRLQPVTSKSGTLDQRRGGLLAELAQLDDDFEASEISEKVYRRLRSEKKNQLVELTQGIKKGKGSR
ncbi:MAG: hypothetical protein Q8O55_03115 [Dehalococcoidales bacterium]|nr:hypothetical protein [Dehalococcoidales bacterium]MDZ4230656.1 hypothetical protein [Dehalococcoidales bacterium]